MVYVQLLKCSELPRQFAVAVFPAALVPMAAQVGRIAWYAHQMTGSLRNRAVAPRAHVGLVRFVRLHTAHLDRAIETVPHRWWLTLSGAVRCAARFRFRPPWNSLFAHAKKAHATSDAMITKALTITT